VNFIHQTRQNLTPAGLANNSGRVFVGNFSNHLVELDIATVFPHSVATANDNVAIPGSEVNRE